LRHGKRQPFAEECGPGAFVEAGCCGGHW
jgi:hypothetical protein